MDASLSAGIVPSRREAPAVLTILAFILVLTASSCSMLAPQAKVETLTVGVPSLEQDALLYVAQQQKLFEGNGLNVVIKGYDSGVSTLRAMQSGEVDIAEAAEFPFVASALQKNDIRVIASNDKFENDYIAARKDRSIGNVSDLKGKRVGVAKQTIAEFYLGRFLALNGMNIRDVTLVDVKPAQFVGAIASGNVDAIIAWQPYVDQIRKSVVGIVVWPAQSNQAVYSVLASRNEWLGKHGDIVQRFLKSLAQAEDYVARNPEDARAIVKERLGYDAAYVAGVWPQHRFSLTLDLSLLVAMDDEAQWMMDNKVTDATLRPNFLSYFYTAGLRAVRPEAVNVSQ